MSHAESGAACSGAAGSCVFDSEGCFSSCPWDGMITTFAAAAVFLVSEAASPVDDASGKESSLSASCPVASGIGGG
jgi:hypothetical protein